MKKRLFAAVIAAMLVLSLAACGKKEKKATDLVTLGQYKGIEVEKTVITVSDDDVSVKIYNNLKDKVVKVDGFDKVKMWDVVNIDFTGYINDVAFEHGSGNAPDLLVGSGTFIPGFEEGLIGAETGTTIKVFTKFPDDYGASDLAGKDAVFVVTVNGISRYPEFTDAFIAENSSYKTLAEYQAGIRSSLESEAEENVESRFKSDVLEKLIAGCTFDDTVKEDADKYAADLKSLYTAYASNYGITLDQFLYYFYGVSEEYFNAQLPEIADFNVKAERAFNAIAEVEKLAVSDEEYNAKVNELMTSSNGQYATAAAVEEAYGKDEIKASILSQKAQDIVFNSAVAK
jgi:trigger factor